MDLEDFIIAIGGRHVLHQVMDYHLKKEDLALFQSFESFVDAGRAKNDPGLFFLSAYIILAYNALSDEVPLSVQIATFADIMTWERWYEKHTGKVGLDRINWLRKHIEGRIFRLGELQFEIDDNIPSWASNICLPVYSVHIPEGAMLRKAEDSFQRALDFFGVEKASFITHSWLLSPEISSMLGDNSAIRYFSSLFEILGYDDDRQAEERLFGTVLDDASAFIPSSSLSSKAKELLLSGGRIRSGYGYLERKIIRQ